MHFLRIAALGVWLASGVCLGQLTAEQKILDFEYLASAYAKFYAPYEWKRELFHFDLYDIGPWIERVRRSRGDLEFYEIASEYVASLRDTHSSYSLPSNFLASVGLTADLYDGKVLIDSIDRTDLPETDYPLQIGDEVLLLDGRPPAEWMREFSRYVTMANPRGTGRLAASFLFFRPQRELPRAHEIGDRLTLVVRLESGETATYSIPWMKRGLPLVAAGPIPTPKAGPVRSAASEQPEYLRLLSALQTRRAPEKGRINGWGARTPWFSLPSSFVRRLGRLPSEFHYSGIYEAEDKRIGFLRIPHFSPFNPITAGRELASEIAYLERNTDGLVVDVTRNPGGSCYGEAALQLLIPYPFRSIGDEIRPNRAFIQELEFALIQARSFHAEEWIIDSLESILQQVSQAYHENRGRTGPVPICGLSNELDPAAGARGNIMAYTKPLILLVDEFTVSWGDAFAAAMQDARRGPLVGIRTDGAGGVIFGGPAGFFSEGRTTYSVTLGTRREPVATAEYPTTAYIENVGVHPEIPLDAMTRENLMSRGRPYVEAFTSAILAEIEKAR
ncbi:MAG: hypothetical protein HYS04_20320 [Acidobacteria bacterium]|nr:hypothetical protein [Acidobacteriota bacterium]